MGSPSWRAATSLLANVEAVYRPDVSRQLHAELLPTIPPDALDERREATVRRADPAQMTGDLDEAVSLLDEAERISGRPDFDAGFPHLLLGQHELVRQVVRAYAEIPDMARYGYRGPLLASLLAAVEGRFDDAAAQLVRSAALVEHVPLRLTDRDVLIGMAVLAHHRGEHRHAAALLATAASGPIWARTPASYALLVHYRRLVRAQLSAEEVRQIRDEAVGRSVDSVLRAEAERLADAEATGLPRCVSRSSASAAGGLAAGAPAGAAATDDRGAGLGAAGGAGLPGVHPELLRVAAGAPPQVDPALVGQRDAAGGLRAGGDRPGGIEDARAHAEGASSPAGTTGETPARWRASSAR